MNAKYNPTNNFGNSNLKLEPKLKSNLNLDAQIPAAKLLHLTQIKVSKNSVSELLILTQRLSVVFAAASFVCLAAVYAWNVHGQKKFDQQFRKLETLKQNERQLISFNESLANDLIANINRLPIKLVREKPQQSIFITASPISLATPTKKIRKFSHFDPLGY